MDLNALRAGLVKDPKYYRFCGYAEALAGNEPARQGLLSSLHLCLYSSFDFLKLLIQASNGAKVFRSSWRAR